MFAVGAVLFMLASLGASMAVDFPMLLGARIAQGLGSSMLMCLFGGLVRNIYPLRLLGIGLSLNAMTVSMTAVLAPRSEEHTSELQSRGHLVCRLLLEKKKNLKKIEW